MSNIEEKVFYQRFGNGDIVYFQNFDELENAIEEEVGSLYYFGASYTCKQLDKIYAKSVNKIKKLKFSQEIKCDKFGESYFGVIQKNNLTIFPSLNQTK